MRCDVLVIGAGGSGAVVAARLSASPDREVVLLEAGTARSDGVGEAADLLRDAATLRASIDPRTSWAHPAELMPGRPWTLARGRALGGSTAVNAGYFLAAGPVDVERWHERIGWAPEAVEEAYARVARAIPVERPPQDDPITRSLTEAATALGLRLAPLPLNVAGQRRWDSARAYLEPARTRPNLDVVTGAEVLHVETRRTASGGIRATGVRALVDGAQRRYEAAEIVLCAGAIGTAHLLLRSGIGPAADLGSAGVPVVADLPVGRATSDHPQVALRWTPRLRPPAGTPLRSVIEAGDIELLPLLTPTDELLGLRPAAASAAPAMLDVLVADQRPDARGTLTLDPGDPAGAPLIRSGYLATERDRRTLREGVRLAAALLDEASEAVDATADLDRDTLATDDALDVWVRDHLGTALHLSGTAKAGRVGDPEAVTDPWGRVLGVTGLRIADLSLLPQVPARGPAATAVMLGELLAEHDRP